MADDFLLIAGPEWEEIPNPGSFINTMISESQVAELIAQQEWVHLSTYLEQAEIIPENAVIQNARMINSNDGENSIRFWIIR